MIIHGDATKIPLADNRIDTCITDPPYELGFMGKRWDSSGVTFQVETWAEVYRVLKPGALLLSFGGTRTYHRMVCAIEDAGFEIRDTIGWVYGSGFPKSYDISKGIDKKAGAEREVVGTRKHTYPDSDNWGEPKNLSSDGYFQSEQKNRDLAHIPITVPSTPEAQLWDGWGTALKPAMELIVVAMKPLDGTYVENALKWGVAGMWIDGARIAINKEKEPRDYMSEPRIKNPDYVTKASGRIFSGSVNYYSKKVKEHYEKGRYPANFIHDGSDEVLEMFPNDTGAYAPVKKGQKAWGGEIYGKFSTGGDDGASFYGDGLGSAARFFYCAKASRAERDAGLEGINPHPTIKPINLIRYLVRLTKTPYGGIVLDPFMGSGTTGCACALEGREFIGIEKEAEYVEIAEKRITYWSKQPKLPVE